ncbi:hypothetical protein EYF80_065187 [Liparis tanakae]|uniref:Uncharacterized protein n=1 Tax=Liparis tanakae TaxID=230148 RepID=A0A4Z2E793_9TELE|nr:hypothetical protein EYF80_065187 [Liparis tanakae]
MVMRLKAQKAPAVVSSIIMPRLHSLMSAQPPPPPPPLPPPPLPPPPPRGVQRGLETVKNFPPVSSLCVDPLGRGELAPPAHLLQPRGPLGSPDNL